MANTLKTCAHGKHYYQKNRKGLYPNYPNPKTETLILTESIIDAATLQQTEIANEKTSILACYGTNGLTKEHTEAVSQLKNLKEIIFFFDGDEAGKEGIKNLELKIKNIRSDIKISYVETPENEDVNSLSIGHEEEIFTYLLENQKTIISF